jgi:hypothetical protein
MTEELTKKWKRLLEVAPKELGVHPDIDPEKMPDWLDHEELKKAQEIFRHHLPA